MTQYPSILPTLLIARRRICMRSCHLNSLLVFYQSRLGANKVHEGVDCFAFCSTLREDGKCFVEIKVKGILNNRRCYF